VRITYDMAIFRKLAGITDQLAKLIVDIATGEVADTVSDSKRHLHKRADTTTREHYKGGLALAHTPAVSVPRLAELLSIPSTIRHSAITTTPPHTPALTQAITPTDRKRPSATTLQ
jgi:hypothetical protein